MWPCLLVCMRKCQHQQLSVVPAVMWADAISLVMPAKPLPAAAGEDKIIPVGRVTSVTWKMFPLIETVPLQVCHSFGPSPWHVLFQAVGVIWVSAAVKIGLFGVGAHHGLRLLIRDEGEQRCIFQQAGAWHLHRYGHANPQEQQKLVVSWPFAVSQTSETAAS